MNDLEKNKWFNWVSNFFSSKILKAIYRDESFVAMIVDILNQNTIDPSALSDNLNEARIKYRGKI